MKQEAKILIGIAVVSIAILFGAIFLLSKQPTSQVTNNTPVDENILVRGDSNKLYPENKKVTIVEFGDFQCPACAAAHPIIKTILSDYSGKVNLVSRNYPLPQHKNAKVAARAAEASGAQGKYFEMFDSLYQNQSQWENESDPTEIFAGYAAEIGLNVDQFRNDLKSDKFDEKISKDIIDGNSVGVNSTPTFFINNQKVSTYDYNTLKSIIEEQLNK